MDVVIGVDPHKASNTIAVLTADETVLINRRFENSVDGFDEMLETVGVSVARTALHWPRLRRVTREGDRVALKLLVDRRRELTDARTQSACRLHRLLRELIPGGARRELSTIKARALLDGVCPEVPVA